MTATETRTTCPFASTRDHFTRNFSTDCDREHSPPVEMNTPPRRKLSREERAQEVHPGSVARRDERIRTIARSFEEITETEEELEDPIPSTSSTSSTSRSPYAVSSESPFSSRRSNSLTNNTHPLVSPKFSRRMFPPRLQRGFSDPVVRRKSSLPSFSPDRMKELGSIEEIASHLLSLPPIPEATTPASPSNIEGNMFKE